MQFFTYQLLELESWTLRPPIDWAGRSIPALFKLKRLRPRYEFNGILIGPRTKLRDVIRGFVQRVNDPRLQEIITLFGPNHTQDAFHFFVCEEQRLDGLITLDLKLRRKFEQTKKRLKSPAIILLPSEICSLVDIDPVGPQWFAEGEKDIFSNKIIQLFSRPASRPDRVAYACYRGLIYLRDKFQLKIRFVIPGY